MLEKCDREGIPHQGFETFFDVIDIIKAAGGVKRERTHSKEWQELADIKAELAERDWFMGTSGNLSIREPKSSSFFYITASGKDKRKQTDPDFLLVDLKENQLKNTNLRPSPKLYFI